MKTIRSDSVAKRFFPAFILSLSLASAGFAQTIPVVTIQATDVHGTWTGDPAIFTVFRSGDSTPALNVYCCISGTATNGVDYKSVGNFVPLPAGVLSNTIVINPINLGQTDTRTVTVDLCPSPLMTPVNYSVGYPSSATVYITPAGVSNLPPAISIVNPTNGAVLAAPANISLIGRAADPDGTVTNLEFFAGTNDLGRGLPVVLDPPGVNGVTGLVYFLNWQNVPAGIYSLTAVAADNGGLSTTSTPVKITVLSTNLPPVVGISWPTNGTTFFGRVVCPPCLTNNPPCELPCYFDGPDINICADASDPDDAVAVVEFFANGHSLGIRTNCPACASPINPFCLVWSNATPGDYALTAAATDNSGLSTTSTPVNITVLAVPPPTNLPPVVRITSPPNGAVFRAPVDIPIYVAASDPDGVVSTVEFFAGGNDLGPGTLEVCVTPLGSCVGCAPPPPICTYSIVWSNAMIGNWTLTAVATDNSGLTATSNPVLVSILPSLPPPTNRPPIVRIVATDPIAIEGTNCWTWRGLVPPNVTWSNWFAPNAAFCLFTNCGPKDATISVFRFGATNDELNVAYAIGGTATNGIDYVALPGLVTIPAGERRADITIIPLDDGPPDITSTVILKLAPDPTATNYLLGLPRAAAAIILDGQSPRAVNGLLPGAVFNISANGPDGAWFHVEYSIDMVHWTPVCTNQVVNGKIDFIDPDAATNPARYYRTMPEAGPPPQ